MKYYSIALLVSLKHELLVMKEGLLVAETCLYSRVSRFAHFQNERLKSQRMKPELQGNKRARCSNTLPRPQIIERALLAGQPCSRIWRRGSDVLWRVSLDASLPADRRNSHVSHFHWQILHCTCCITVFVPSHKLGAMITKYRPSNLTRIDVLARTNEQESKEGADCSRTSNQHTHVSHGQFRNSPCPVLERVICALERLAKLSAQLCIKPCILLVLSDSNVKMKMVAK